MGGRTHSWKLPLQEEWVQFLVGELRSLMQHRTAKTFFGCFPAVSSGKEAACQCRRYKRHRLSAWVEKIPWGRAWQPTPVFSPGESHGQWTLVGYSPSGCKELNATEVTEHAWTNFYIIIDVYFQLLEKLIYIFYICLISIQYSLNLIALIF